MAIVGAEPVNAELTPQKPVAADGKLYDCYAIDTRPGSRWIVTAQSRSFDPGLQIARGALCSAAALQHQNDNLAPGTSDAQISFAAAGGRYLIMVRSMSGATGPYALTARPDMPAAVAQLEAVAAEDEPMQMAVNTADARKALMEQQVGQRRAEIAAVEAQKRAAEAARQARIAQQQAAERARKAQAKAEFNAFLGAAIGAASQVVSDMSVQRAQEQALAAQRQAEAAQRAVAQQRAQAAQQQVAAAQQRAQAAAQAPRTPSLTSKGGYGIGYSPTTRASASQTPQQQMASSGGSAASRAPGQQQIPSTADLYKTTPQGTFMDHDAAIKAAIAAQRGGGVPQPGQAQTQQPAYNAAQQQQLRIAQQNAQQAQQRVAEAQRIQQERAAMARTAAGNWSHAATTTASAPASRSATGASAPILEWREGIAICETAGGKLGRCAGPQLDTFLGTLEERVNHACQSKDWRELNGEKGYRIFACGYGIKPGHTAPWAESFHFDWAAEKGLVVPGRRTFRCPATPPGGGYYCRS
jgi:hypothetical protein